MSIPEYLRISEQLKSAAMRSLDVSEPLTTITTQPDRAVFLAEQAQLIAKVYRNNKLLERERNMFAAAENSDIPVPQVISFELGPPAVLVTKKVYGEELSDDYPNAATEAGMYLKRLHDIGAKPPFAGGQFSWGSHIISWANHEIDALEKRHHLLNANESTRLKVIFELKRADLDQRPVVLLHGDLQPNHIIVGPQTDKVNAFIDFVDVQPGDPLWDIAVVSLWNESLADLVLQGYADEDLKKDAPKFLYCYRLLRHIAEIPWRLERGFSTEKNIAAVQKALSAV